MRLQFDKSGRRFFFLTFCVRGRKAVLSRVVEKTGRDGRSGYAVELTPAGEAMAALWRATHARWPFLLLDAGLEEWCLPFIVSLCDDYVVEIVETVYNALRERNNDDIKAFCKRNESSVRKSYSRMISYWNEYYRRTDKHWKLNEYVGRKLFKECFGIYE